jgi:tetratricopeptide (TPR) repeat protein
VAPIDESNNDASEDVPEWLTDGDLDSDDAIAWLEEIAAKYDPNFEGSGEEASDSEEPEAEPEEIEEAEEEEEVPDWLKTTAAGPAVEAMPVAFALPDEDEDEEEEEADEGLPDWLKTTAAEPAAEAVPVTAALPDEDEDEEEEEELPDWLKAVAPAPAAIPAAEVEVEPAAESSAMAWLDEQAEMQGVGAGEVVSEALTADRPPTTSPDIPPPDAEAEAVSDEELPDWLKSDEVKEAKEKAMVMPTGELDEAIAAAAVTAEEDDIAWLESALESEESPEADLPDWLKEEPAKAAEEPRAGVVEEAEEEEEEELPDWLKGVEEQPTLSWHISTSEVAAAAAESEEVEPAEGEEEELPDWLQGIGTGPTPADTAPFIEPAAEKEPEEEALPDWITGKLAGEEEEEELPDWLAEKPAVPAAAAPVAEIEEEPEEEEEEEIPDWLAEKPAVPAAAAPVAEIEEEPEEEEEEEIPDWLAEKPAAPAVAAPVAAVEEEAEEEEEEAPPWLTEAPAAPALEEKPSIPVPAAPPAAVPSEIAGDFNEQLRIAREKLSAKAIEEALPYYESLIGSKKMLDQTISDLLYAIKTEEKTSPRLRRVLGDAYRSQGQLQEALEVYRQALDEL